MPVGKSYAAGDSNMLLYQSMNVPKGFRIEPKHLSTSNVQLELCQNGARSC